MFSLCVGMQASNPVQVPNENLSSETFCQKISKYKGGIAYALDTITAMGIIIWADKNTYNPYEGVALGVWAGIQMCPAVLTLILARSGLITVPKPQEVANNADQAV